MTEAVHGLPSCDTVTQEGMPNSLGATRSSKPVTGSHAATAAVSAPVQPDQHDPHSGLQMLRNESRHMGSASSSDSERSMEGQLPFAQAAVPNLPADQHALNDLSELHSRAGVVVSSPDTSGSGSGRRAPPSRASSWGSSRAGSAVRRSSSKLASTPETDAETDQLTLHGMSIV